MPAPRLLALIAAGTLALGAAACGGEDDAGEPAPDRVEATTTPEAPKTTEGGAADDLSSKPAVEVPSEGPPAELEVEDLVEGKGPKAKKGDRISVQYVGVSYSTGEEFDASWDRGEPFTFQLGAGQVITGWDEGLVGMREGGRRKLTIPPDQAYGPAGSPPAIGPDETLIFIVDLEKIG